MSSRLFGVVSYYRNRTRAQALLLSTVVLISIALEWRQYGNIELPTCDPPKTIGLVLLALLATAVLTLASTPWYAHAASKKRALRCALGPQLAACSRRRAWCKRGRIGAVFCCAVRGSAILGAACCMLHAACCMRCMYWCVACQGHFGRLCAVGLGDSWRARHRRDAMEVLEYIGRSKLDPVAHAQQLGAHACAGHVRGNAQVRRRMPSWWQRRTVNVRRRLTSPCVRCRARAT